MRRHNDLPLGDVLKLLFKDEKWKSKLFQAKVQQIWKDKMGEMIFKYTVSIVLNNRILYIKISSSSLKQELLYGREQIKDLINLHLEEDYVTDVMIS